MATFPGDLDHTAAWPWQVLERQAVERLTGTFKLVHRSSEKAQTMQHRCLHEQGGQRTFVVVLETGEEVMSCLQQFVSGQNIRAAQLTAMGAFSDAVLMYFDWAKKDYVSIPVREQVEVASLLGVLRGSPRFTPIWWSESGMARPWLDTLTKHMCGQRSKSL